MENLTGAMFHLYITICSVAVFQNMENLTGAMFHLYITICSVAVCVSEHGEPDRSYVPAPPTYLCSEEAAAYSHSVQMQPAGIRQ